MLRTILNVIWLVLCGFWLAILYALAGLVCFVLFFLVVTIPLGIAAFRIAGYVLWPFGRSIEVRRDAGLGSLIGNVIWIVLFGWWLALGLANLANIFDPATIVIGGGLVEAGRILLEPVREAFESLVEAVDYRPTIDIVGARLGEQAGAVGAALLAREHPTTVEAA